MPTACVSYACFYMRIIKYCIINVQHAKRVAKIFYEPKISIEILICKLSTLFYTNKNFLFQTISSRFYRVPSTLMNHDYFYDNNIIYHIFDIFYIFAKNIIVILYKILSRYIFYTCVSLHTFYTNTFYTVAKNIIEIYYTLSTSLQRMRLLRYCLFHIHLRTFSATLFTLTLSIQRILSISYCTTFYMCTYLFTRAFPTLLQTIHASFRPLGTISEFETLKISLSIPDQHRTFRIPPIREIPFSRSHSYSFLCRENVSRMYVREGGETMDGS